LQKGKRVLAYIFPGDLTQLKLAGAFESGLETLAFLKNELSVD